MPEMHVEFCRFANADSFIRLDSGSLRVRISDLLAAAPAPVMEALAFILLGKLYRKPVARLTRRFNAKAAGPLPRLIGMGSSPA